jgi:hypothetical protein
MIELSGEMISISQNVEDEILDIYGFIQPLAYVSDDTIKSENIIKIHRSPS